MTHFRTELFIDENPDKINYDSKILSIGSGFSKIFKNHLSKYNFDINNNPFGTIYNPISIFNLIHQTLENKEIDQNYITENDGYWNHFDFHPKVKSGSKAELIDQLQTSVNSSHEYLKETDFLILTLGSAFVYKLTDNQKTVANCHRAARNKFDKQLLSTQEIVDGFRSVYGKLNHVKNIVLVVSPVQHTKDSLTLNAVSKSTLRLACHQIMSEFPYVKYFPAYEFLTSDLRDYRFYQRDLIHPNELAMDYIFKKFVESYLHEDIKNEVLSIEDLLSSMHHEPYNHQSTEYQKSVKKVMTQIDQLSDKMDLSSLLEELKEKIV